VHIDSLEAHLTTAMPERAAATAAARGRRPTSEPGRVAGAGTSDAHASGPPAVDFTSMLELGQAIDAEMVRLAQSADFFDGVASRASLPRIVRQSAARARDLLRSSIGLFAGDGGEPHA
jgi:hypothetical protein